METEELTFIKRCEIEPDLFLLFKDINGEFRVVEEGNYKSFNLKQGEIVHGLVRSRGCAGQEITELFHPYYKTGEIYTFSVLRQSSIRLNEQAIHILVIQNNSGDEFKLKLEEDYVFCKGSQVQCKLVEQRKGRLIFNLV